MPTEIPLKRDTPIVWSDTTDFSSPTHGLTRTHQIDLTSIAAGAARQGEDADLTTLKADFYTVKLCVEFGATPPTNGQIVSVYFGSSASASAGMPGGLGVSDAAYAPYTDQLDYCVRQLVGPFIMVVHDQGAGTLEIAELGVLHGSAVDRYVVPVVYNEADQAFDSDATNMYLALIPHIRESQ